MFEEIVKKFEEIVHVGIKDVKEEVASLKARLEALEKHSTVQDQDIQAVNTETATPAQEGIAPVQVPNAPPAV